MMRRVLIMGAAGLSAACGARGSGERASTPTAAVVSVTGIVRVVGADPFAQVVVQEEGGRATAVVGPLRMELEQTAGLLVQVTGVRTDPVTPADLTLEARSYETVSLNGVPAYAGVLEGSETEIRLVGTSRRWTLANPPAELWSSIGAKVWVAGEGVGGSLRVTAYGIIRRASSP